MNDISIVGVDLAKRVFQIHAEDENGAVVCNKKLTRKKFKAFMATKLPPCTVAMEACGTAHYWARELKSMGHKIKLINPRIVKAYVIRNKNDARDAEAICEAARSKKVQNIPIKTIAQQNLTTLHRARRQIVKRITQIANHMRSMLAEYGIITQQGHRALERLIREVINGSIKADGSEELRFVLEDMLTEWKALQTRRKRYDVKIKVISKANKTATQLMTIPGIGELTATAVVAKVDDFHAFKKGKNFAAWLGLTPKEYSSAGKRVLGGISKQGDRYVRTLLIHGARSAMHAALRKENKLSSYHCWIRTLVERVGKNKAVVALANKHARMIWALIKHGRELDLNFSKTFA